MRPSRTNVLLLFLLATALVACQQATATVTAVPPAQTRAPLPGTGAGDTVPQDEGDVPRITTKELRDMLTSARRVVVIDVRGYDAFAVAHIPGALNMPNVDSEDQHSRLPRDVPIVLYCA